MKYLALSTLLLLACHREAAAQGPVPVAYDRDVCNACGMVISEPQFATQVLTPDGKRAHFDDLGCALTWLDRQKFRDDENVKVWVSTKDGTWVDARGARFATGATSPMGFNLQLADSGLDFRAVRSKVAERAGGSR